MREDGLRYRSDVGAVDQPEPAIPFHRRRGRGSWQGVVLALLSVISVTVLLVYL